MTRVTALLLVLPVLLGAAVAEAKVIRVPQDRPDIRQAVEIALSGDTIKVGPGRWCGAQINTANLTLVGDGDTVIAGATLAGPCSQVAIAGANRWVGFVLGPGASGTTIRHFRFDASGGAGLEVGVFGSGASGVVVEHNRFEGAHRYAVRNDDGGGWVVQHNRVEGLSAFSGFGGAAILVQHTTGLNRPGNNVVRKNRVQASQPAGMTGNWFSGVAVAGAEKTEVEHNKFRLTSGGSGPKGTGVLVTAGPMPGSMGPVKTLPGVLPKGSVTLVNAPPKQVPQLAAFNTSVERNDGRRSDLVAALGGGPDKQVKTSLRGNKGAWQDETGAIISDSDRGRKDDRDDEDEEEDDE